MTDTDTVEAKPQPTYHLDRPSARTHAEREAHWQRWWEKHGEPYQAAVIEAGGIPWTTDVEERKALWMKRYDKR
jgi:hypothetical protein